MKYVGVASERGLGWLNIKDRKTFKNEQRSRDAAAKKKLIQVE